MIYFLDTNICIFHLNQKSQNILDKFNEIGNGNIKIPSVVSAELYYGAEKSAKRAYNLQRYNEFISWFRVAPFYSRASRIYGEIRAELERKGKMIGWNDLLIAATVMASGGVLVTNNTDEFSRIDKLILEDWTKEK